jgi:hypothetical protein
MSLITSTIYNAPWWTIGGFDYLTGTVSTSGTPAQPGLITLPSYFNKHTLWLAHFQFPAGLLATSVFASQIQGLFVNFYADTVDNNYPLYFFRPPSCNNQAGNLSSAALTGPGLITDQTLKTQYTYGIGGGASGLATIIGTFARDTMMQIPLSTVTGVGNFVDHFAPDAMVHCSIGGTNTTPNSLTVANMGICTPIEVDFPANKISVICPNLSGVITPTNAAPYWCYGFFLIRSEQV